MCRKERKRSDAKCIAITKKKTRCKFGATFDNLCSRHHKQKMLKEGKPLIIEHDGPTKSCSNNSHSSYGSKYSIDKVPIEHFLKNGKIYYKNCIDCRIYIRDAQKRRKEILSKINTNDENYGVCFSEIHDTEGNSQYPRDKVPIILFDTHMKESNGEIVKSSYCSDCRNIASEKNRKRLENKIKNAKKDGKHVCLICNNVFEKEKMYINLNGSLGSTCIECQSKQKETNKERADRTKSILKKIKLEMFIKCESSCQRCNSIFIKPSEGTEYARELQTYLRNNIRYVKYENVEYKSLDFIKKFTDLLELRIIDLDHLPEKEQRERLIIKDDEPAIKKKRHVCNMPTEHEMRNEAKITQNLCCRCHVIVTKERQRNDYKPCYNRMIKSKYVQTIKSEGCSVCGFSDINLLCYFEMDHIDPNQKKECISIMVNDDYTLDDVIEECKKCRVLCRSCHRIHTDEQRQQGII